MLSLNQTWLPAVENRGEGFFIGFKPAAVEAWLKQEAVQTRGEQLKAGFDAWVKGHAGVTAKFAGLPYVMLHSLSHLLITAVALDCGYAASSIRERIHVSGAGYGILLYTASPDAEGTLGGLVEAADRIDQYLRHAIDLGQLCANDPVCAQHQPENPQEERFLLGAACHGCLLLAESSQRSLRRKPLLCARSVRCVHGLSTPVPAAAAEIIVKSMYVADRRLVARCRHRKVPKWPLA